MLAYDLESKLFKVLMHPVRLALLNVLRQGEACVSHLEVALGQRQAYISQQLAVLREAGLVRDRRAGWNVYYQIADPRIFAVLDAALGYTGGSARPPEQRLPARLTGCTCPRCRPDESEEQPE